jgi:hypothetical protein
LLISVLALAVTSFDSHATFIFAWRIDGTTSADAVRAHAGGWYPNIISRKASPFRRFPSLGGQVPQAIAVDLDFDAATGG